MNESNIVSKNLKTRQSEWTTFSSVQYISFPHFYCVNRTSSYKKATINNNKKPWGYSRVSLKSPIFMKYLKTEFESNFELEWPHTLNMAKWLGQKLGRHITEHLTSIVKWNTYRNTALWTESTGSRTLNLNFFTTGDLKGYLYLFIPASIYLLQCIFRGGAGRLCLQVNWYSLSVHRKLDNNTRYIWKCQCFYSTERIWGGEGWR